MHETGPPPGWGRVGGSPLGAVGMSVASLRGRVCGPRSPWPAGLLSSLACISYLGGPFDDQMAAGLTVAMFRLCVCPYSDTNRLVIDWCGGFACCDYGELARVTSGLWG